MGETYGLKKGAILPSGDNGAPMNGLASPSWMGAAETREPAWQRQDTTMIMAITRLRVCDMVSTPVKRMSFVGTHNLYEEIPDDSVKGAMRRASSDQCS